MAKRVVPLIIPILIERRGIGVRIGIPYFIILRFSVGCNLGAGLLLRLILQYRNSLFLSKLFLPLSLLLMLLLIDLGGLYKIDSRISNVEIVVEDRGVHFLDDARGLHKLRVGDLAQRESLLHRHQDFFDQVNQKRVPHSSGVVELDLLDVVVGFLQVLSREGSLSKGHVEDSHAQTPNVYSLVVLLFKQHFGRHVVRRSTNGVLLKVFFSDGEPEVPQLDLVIEAQEEIGGLDISVNDSMGMEISESIDQLVDEEPDLHVIEGVLVLQH